MLHLKWLRKYFYPPNWKWWQKMLLQQSCPPSGALSGSFSTVSFLPYFLSLRSCFG
ncbi:hypothetical protein ACHAWF_004222 [Thalassiosira exigua]